MDNIEFADKVSDLIVEGNVKEVKDLLKDKFSDTKELNEMAKMGWWLKEAVRYQQMEIVEFLIELGVDVNMVVLSNKGNVLCDAARTGNMEMIEFLIEKGIDISCTLDELNPVLCAVCGDWLEVVKYLLEKEKEMLQPLEYEELIKKVIDYADIVAGKKVLDYLGVKKEKKKKKKITKADKNKMISLLKKGIQEFFKNVIKTCKNEQLYIISFALSDPLSDVSSYCGVYMNTEENLKRQIEDADEEDKEDVFYYRYCEDEWDVLEEDSKYFQKFFDYIEKKELDSEDIMEWYELVVEAVCLLRDEEYFEKTYKDDVLITIYAHNYCEQDEMIELFKRMNKGKKCEDYIENIEDFF